MQEPGQEEGGQKLKHSRGEGATVESEINLAGGVLAGEGQDIKME